MVREIIGTSGEGRPLYLYFFIPLHISRTTLCVTRSLVCVFLGGGGGHRGAFLKGESVPPKAKQNSKNIYNYAPDVGRCWGVQVFCL